jgi:hypothetical protein
VPVRIQGIGRNLIKLLKGRMAVWQVSRSIADNRSFSLDVVPRPEERAAAVGYVFAKVRLAATALMLSNSRITLTPFFLNGSPATSAGSESGSLSCEGVAGLGDSVRRHDFRLSPLPQVSLRLPTGTFSLSGAAKGTGYRHSPGRYWVHRRTDIAAARHASQNVQTP